MKHEHNPSVWIIAAGVLIFFAVALGAAIALIITVFNK